MKENLFLILADISGYTKFMLANKTELEHGQKIINELIHSIINEAQIPIIVNKLEGDAVFMYAHSNPESKKHIEEKYIDFFESFHSKLNELHASLKCPCGACSNVNELKLKVITHYGEVLFSKINDFEELAGIDVIIAHRLLKNTITAKEYLLLTDNAKAEMNINIPLDTKIEPYEDVGEIKVHYHSFDKHHSSKVMEYIKQIFKKAA